MKIEETKFYKFAENFCKENDKEFDGTRFVFFHNNDVPFDSVDRIYALYLIDSNSHLLDIDIDEIVKDKNKQTNEYMYSLMTEEEKEEFKLVTNWAYDNYEREMMSPYVAFFNIVGVAKKGKEVTLKDSYYDGGWFGAS
jgi:hypothetical protein